MFDLNSHKEYPMDIIHSWKSADRNFLCGGDTSNSSVSHPNCSSDSSTKMSEKLCLQWNDFEDNIKSAFGNLREDKDFADVTLVSENGQQVEAHKMILAVSSPASWKAKAPSSLIQ